MGNDDVMMEFGPSAGPDGGSKSYVVVEAGPEVLRVYRYSLGLGANGGPVSLKKRQRYELPADEFEAKIPEIERELGTEYSEWRFRPGLGELGSCGDHLKL